MNYTEAIEAVEDDSKYAWRSAWEFGFYIHLNGSQIYIYTGTPGGGLYTPSEQDQAATDWAEGDRPPH